MTNKEIKLDQNRYSKVEKALSGFDKKQRKSWSDEWTLKWLVYHDYIDVTVDFFETRTFTPPDGWIEDNMFNASQGNESDRHKRLKVLAAVYLDTNGCELRNIEPEVANHSVSWEYMCFESASEYGRADLSCLNCIKIVECGTTEPKKCIDALGIETRNFEGRFLWDKEALIDPDKFDLVRFHDKVDEFITMPYTGTVKNEDRKVVGYKMYRYTRTEKFDSLAGSY